MKIQLNSVTVNDQSRALKFYTEILGFVVKHDIPMGEYRWLTVTSPEGHADIELVLEPAAFPPAQVYQKALLDAGIPATAFTSNDIEAEHQKLTGLGVTFKTPPTTMGPVKVAMFEDTCGNLIQLYQAI